MMGGTGGGKTWWGPYWLMRVISRDRMCGIGRGARYLVIGPTREMTRDMLVPAFIDSFVGTEYEGEYAIGSNIYSLPSGGKVYFRSADEPLRIEGHHVHGIWVDEPSQMKAGIWPVIQSRSGFFRAPVLFTGYPTDMGWYYHDIYKPWERGDPDYFVIQFDSTENPLYPKAEYERAKRTMPAWLFDMRYRGLFRKPFGLVYPTFGSGCVVEPFDIPSDWPTYVGLDPSVFFGALFVAWQDGVYYAYDEYYTEILETAAVHAGEMSAKVRGVPQWWIYDPARLTDANELAKCGIGPMTKAANAVLTGITTLTGFINSGRFKVMRGRCRNFVDQMEKYSFPTNPATGDVAKENPIKKDDHLPDCARYLIHTLEGAQEEQRVTEVVVYEDNYSITRY